MYFNSAAFGVGSLKTDAKNGKEVFFVMLELAVLQYMNR